MQVIVGQLMLDDARQILAVFRLQKVGVDFQMVVIQVVAPPGRFHPPVDLNLVDKGTAEGFQGNFLNQLLQFLFINHRTIVALIAEKNSFYSSGNKTPSFILKRRS